jgi:hypothetical protein
MCSLIEKETILLAGSRPTARSTGLLKQRYGMTGSRQVGGSGEARQAAANNDHRGLSTWMCHHYAHFL